MAKWGILGAICGVCLAPFTGGTSLALTCAACAGVGFVAGSVIEKVTEDDKSSQRNQAPSEAYKLMGKSIEELTKTVNDLQEQLKKDKNEKANLQENLADIQSKLNNPNLPRDPHETDEYLEEQKLFTINELRKINNRMENNERQLTQARNAQTNAATTGANVAGGSINGANWNNTVDSFKPDFTTKLIIAGVVALIIYFLVVKEK